MITVARHCRACAAGDHPDCTRWLMRDHPCQCVCDDAPRQLSLPFGNLDEPVSAGRKRVGRARPEQDAEVPW